MLINLKKEGRGRKEGGRDGGKRERESGRESTSSKISSEDLIYGMVTIINNIVL